MGKNKTEIFESMPVRSAVRVMIIPAVISQMVTLLYNLADTVFVGMLNDPSQTASVSMGASFLLMLTAISNLFGIGGASTLAQALGGRKTGKFHESRLSLFGSGCSRRSFFLLLFLY